LRLLILVAREGFLKDKCGPRAKKFEHDCSSLIAWRIMMVQTCTNSTRSGTCGT